MSILSNPKPPTESEAGQAASAPAEAPPQTSSRRRLLGFLAVAALVIVAAYQLWWKPQQVTKTLPFAAVPTARVTAGSLERVVRLSGVTLSQNYINIRAPQMRGGERSPLVILALTESGARVNAGDVIAEIDGQRMQDHIDDVDATVVAAAADIRKRGAEQDIDWEKLQQNIKVAKADLDKWKLEDSAGEIRTVIDQELIQLAVEETEAYHEQLRSDLGYEKTAQEAEIRILDITRDRHVRHRERHERDLERYTVRSPMDGMAVRQEIFRSGEMSVIQQGDQIYPGMLFMKVMDTSRMELEGQINQAESSLFRIGQTATIGLDAFPEVEFKGRVYSVGALAKGSGAQSDYVRQISIRVAIEGSDPRLIPDLSGYADVLVDKADNVKQVPLGAIFEENGQSVVFVKNGENYERRPVEIGFRNYTHAAVLSGLEIGEEVAVERPAT